ncbi:MAG: hypothetical protein ACKOXH_08745 [Aquirufa sp.]|jgi:hypothetical protein
MKLNQITKIEKMELTAINWKSMFWILFLFFINPTYGQIDIHTSKLEPWSFSAINPKEPFYYYGNKKRVWETHCYETLENDIVNEVPVPADILCRNNIGFFAFLINKNGRLERLEYQGDLDPIIVEKIKSNIRKTDRQFVKPIKSLHTQKHWFLLPFLSNAYHLNYRKCPNVDQLETEFDFVYKHFKSYLKLQYILPESTSITHLHPMDHFGEMIKKGMIQGEIY